MFHFYTNNGVSLRNIIFIRNKWSGFLSLLLHTFSEIHNSGKNLISSNLISQRILAKPKWQPETAILLNRTTRKEQGMQRSHRRCSVKRSCSEKFRNINRKTPVLESFFNKVQETSTQVFSCEYC